MGNTKSPALGTFHSVNNWLCRVQFDLALFGLVLRRAAAAAATAAAAASGGGQRRQQQATAGSGGGGWWRETAAGGGERRAVKDIWYFLTHVGNTPLRTIAGKSQQGMSLE
eukprot:gene19344-biopygen13016